jgi:hypothetical protein
LTIVTRAHLVAATDAGQGRSVTEVTTYPVMEVPVPDEIVEAVEHPTSVHSTSGPNTRVSLTDAA